MRLFPGFQTYSVLRSGLGSACSMRSRVTGVVEMKAMVTGGLFGVFTMCVCRYVVLTEGQRERDQGIRDSVFPVAGEQGIMYRW